MKMRLVFFHICILLAISGCFGASRYLAQTYFDGTDCKGEPTGTIFHQIDYCYDVGGSDVYFKLQYNGTSLSMFQFDEGDVNCAGRSANQTAPLGPLPQCFDQESGEAFKFEIVSKTTPLSAKTALTVDLYGAKCARWMSSIYYYVPLCVGNDNEASGLDCKGDKGIQYNCKDKLCRNCVVNETIDLNVCLPQDENYTSIISCVTSPPFQFVEIPQVELVSHDENPRKLRSITADWMFQGIKSNLREVMRKTGK